MYEPNEPSAAPTVIEITAEALEQILGLRAMEDDQESLVLSLRIAGVGFDGFRYETAFMPASLTDPDDVVEDHGGLPVVIPSSSVDRLRGAVLDMSQDPTAPGLVLRNPNPASPGMGAEGIPQLDASLPVADRVTTVLDQYINPAIAAHGGITELVGIEGSTAYLRMGGGCQGCGLAALTLRQGIEVALTQAVPEITEVVDATDHAAGTNPFYESSAK